MEHQDNIFEQFKKAAEKSETKDFSGLEKVWSRVDAKLDTQVYQTQKKTNASWGKFAIAASLVVSSVIAYQFLREEKTILSPQHSVVVNDSVTTSFFKDTATAIVATEPKEAFDKKTAEKVLQKQINAQTIVMNEASAKLELDSMVISKAIVMADKAKEKEEINPAVGYFNSSKENRNADRKYSEDVAESIYKSESKKAKQVAQKAPPLVVVNGSATQTSIAEMDDIESIVELKEPLYIINGIEYSEASLFGPNPTSPYYPLNKQEIVSVSIYKDEEAIEKFGQKGNKGVVVVTTKNGKPKTASK